MIHYLFINNHS